MGRGIVLAVLLSTTALRAEEPGGLRPAIGFEKQERNGRQNRIAGAALIGSGMALNVLGAFLTAYAFTHFHESCYVGYFTSCTREHDKDAYNTSLTAWDAGSGAMVWGMTLYFAGRAQEKKARAARTANGFTF